MIALFTAKMADFSYLQLRGSAVRDPSVRSRELHLLLTIGRKADGGAQAPVGSTVATPLLLYIEATNIICNIHHSWFP